jgi:hypothetical protein
MITLLDAIPVQLQVAKSLNGVLQFVVNILEDVLERCSHRSMTDEIEGRVVLLLAKRCRLYEEFRFDSREHSQGCVGGSRPCQEGWWCCRSDARRASHRSISYGVLCCMNVCSDTDESESTEHAGSGQSQTVFRGSVLGPVTDIHRL